MKRLALVALLAVAACGSDDEPHSTPNPQTIPRLRGVNLAGAEFGDHTIPGTRGEEYEIPNNAEVDYFVSKGMNALRLPVKIERLQRTLNGPVGFSEIDPFIAYATTTRSAYVILDPHDYARRAGQLYGSATMPSSALADFWRKAAEHYKTNARVVFGLMNEPFGITAAAWLPIAQESINAIRDTGATNLILVPGVQYTGAWCWTDESDAMSAIEDDNVVFEMHQYFNNDYSGATPDCVHGAETLEAATAWLEQHGKKALLGELGGANNAGCTESLNDALTYMEGHSDQWFGWTWWAAGPWWGDYMFSVEPNADGSDKPQMQILEAYLD